MDAWEVWDLEGEDGNEVGNELSPILSSCENSIDISKHEIYMSGDGSINGLSTSTRLTVAAKLDVSISEKPDIVSPLSPYRSRRRNHSTRTDSSSGLEDNIGLTNSYTLDEPGKEKRHVLVVSGSIRKSDSTNSPKTSHDRKNSFADEYEDDSLNGGDYRRNSFNDERRRSSFNGELRKNSLNGEHDNNSFDGQHEYKTNKELSSSTSAIRRNVYSNANNNISNGLETSHTRENKSIFTKAKQFFKSPTRKSTKLDQSTKNRSRSNSTSTDDGLGLTDSFKVTTSQGEEKHVLVLSRSGSFSSPKLTGKLNSSDSSQGKMSSREVSDSSACNTPERRRKILFERKKTSPKTRSNDRDEKSGRTMDSSNTSPEKSMADDYSDIEDEYDIINILKPITIEPDSKTIGVENTEHCIPKDAKYDIVFKPEKAVTGSNQDDEVSPIRPLQQGLMSLIVGVGLGEEEETRNVVTHMVHPHSVEEHGKFQLTGGRNDDSKECRNETDVVPKTSDLPDRSAIPVLAMTGLLLGTPAVNTNIFPDKLQQDSVMSGSEIGKSECNDDDYADDDDFVVPTLHIRYPMTSTPIKSNVKYTGKKAVNSDNSTHDNNKNELRNTPHHSPEITQRNKHIRTLKFHDDTSTGEECQRQHSSLKEQYGIDDVSLSSDVNQSSLSSNEDSSLSSSSSPNTTSEGYEEDYEMESDQIAAMSDDSIDTINLNKDVIMKLEDYEEVSQDPIDPSDGFPERKVSTDSLASFEFHEKELMNQGSPMSPRYPLSPNRSMRSPKTVCHVPGNGGYLHPCSSYGCLSGPDTLDDEEVINDFMNDISTERRLTTDLLNYMPAIEEGSESFCMEGEDQRSEPSVSIQYQCRHTGKDSSEKGTSDTSVNVKQNHTSEKENIENEEPDDPVNIDMGSDVSKIGGKKKVKRSSRKNSKSKKKKGKSPLADSLDEERISQSPSEKSLLDETDATEGIEVDKNGNIFQETENKVSENGRPDSGVCFKEDPDFAIKEAVHRKKHQDKNKQSNPHTDTSKNNATEKIKCSSGVYLDANKAYVTDTIKNTANEEKTPSENKSTNVCNGNIPLDSDKTSVISGDSNLPQVNSSITNGRSNKGVLSKDDGDKPKVKQEEHSKVNGDNTSESKTNARVNPSAKMAAQPRDTGGLEKGNETDMPKKCLWYDYSKDETSEENKTFPHTITVKGCATNEDLNKSADDLLAVASHGSNNQSKSTENVSMHIVFLEDETNGKPVVRSKSVGPSSTRKRYINKVTANDTDKTSGESNLKSTEENASLYNDNSENPEFLTIPKLIVTQASVESTDGDSGVEQAENFHTQNERPDAKSKTNVINLEDEDDEDERDSGTEQRYEEFLSNEPGHSDYEKWVENIKPLLHDAELVANLYLRLANKYGKCRNNNEEPLYIQHLHSAQIAYDVIKAGNLTNFASVITYLLSYMGAIKSENALPENISIPDLLIFLEEIIKRNTMTSDHVSMFTCFLSRPNKKLTAHHGLRMSFLQTAFEQEISQLNVNTEEPVYLRVCFMKISEYFIQLDMDTAHKMTKEYILPHLTDSNSTVFIMNALTYMGLVKSKEPTITTDDVTSPLILLDIIFRSKKISLLTSQKLYAFIQLNNPRFRFCNSERERLTKTLQRAINF